MTFDMLNLNPQLLKAVKESGYETPTPIQEKGIPPVMEGRDVMGLAQTGTGKTAAFVLPILQRLMQGPRGHIRALVVAPTRELAVQIEETFQTLGKYSRLRSVTIYGGVGMEPQIRKVRSGAEIVVACPGRLLDHISRRTVNLSKVEVLVLDEADRMFDMGFLPDIKRILNCIPDERQTLLFSATMPDDIRHLANDILVEPVTVQVDRTAPAATVSHALFPVDENLKISLLMEILNQTDKESVLIFTRTKHRAKRIAERIEKSGFSATSLQGNLSQNKRQAALDGFRDGTFQIMVATDIAARGIDVSSISHVINYDMPDTAEAYTHRIGRTGRAAKTGDAFTFVTNDDRIVLMQIERMLGAKIERRMLEGFDYKSSVVSEVPSLPTRRDYRSNNGGRKPAAPGRHAASDTHSANPRAASGGPGRKPSPAATDGHGGQRPATRQPQNQERKADFSTRPRTGR